MQNLGYTVTKIGQLTEITTLKIVSSFIIGIAFFLFGSLYTQALIAIAMLMIFDTILGISASFYEGTSISSKKFSRAVIKGTVYFMAISAGYFTDLTIPMDFIQATMVGFVGVTEFISILENMGRMGYQTPKRLLNQLKEKYHPHEQ